MTQDLRSSLEDLATQGPPGLVPHELARAAWSQGRRRRRLRLATVATLVLAVLSVGVGVATRSITFEPQLLAPVGGSGSSTLTGYPERIGHQWWVRELPATPGPMALLLQRVVHRGSYDDPAGWEAVSESGQRWRIPDVYGDDIPALSPDGSRLAYLSGPQGPYVIRDLVTGHVTTFPSVGSSSLPARTAYMAQGQSPAFWSPDGRHVVLPGFSSEPPNSGRALVLGVNGTVHLTHGRGFPAGWRDARTILWLTPSAYGAGKAVPLDIRFTDLSCTAVQPALVLATPPHLPAPGQLSAAVSPDGTEVAVILGWPGVTLRRYSLVDGQSVGSPTRIENHVGVCPAAWTDSAPVLPILEGDNVYPAEVSSARTERLIAIEPRLGSECVVWAANALAGTRHEMLYGLSMAPWTWWWRETALGLLVVGSLAWFARRRVVVRRRRGD